MSCPKNMAYEDCELLLADNTAKAALYEKGKEETSSEFFVKMTKICEDFIRKTKAVVYGGTAINTLLPKESKFYNPEIDIPDYDIYTSDPIRHAKQAVDMFIKAGFIHVEAKSANHQGTYKVFVEFVGALDITFMPVKLFKLVQKNALVRDGMFFCHPDLLRQAMYIELANPHGDVDRWKKVLPRLHKLNEAYPLKAGKCGDLKSKVKVGPVDETLNYIVEEVLITEEVVFLGGFAHSYYLPTTSPTLLKSEDPGYYDIIVEKPVAFIKKVTAALKKADYANVTKTKHAAVGELIGPYYEVKINDRAVLNIFEPTRCYAYNEVPKDGKTVRVASFDTLLAFYFAFLYADFPHFNKKRILCMAEMLFKVMHDNVQNQKGVLKRFPMKCYGKSETLRTMKAHKWDLRKKLKKGTVAYNRWFFKYVPFMPTTNSAS